MAIIKLVFVWLFSLTQILNPFFQFTLNGGIRNSFEDWSPEQAFTRDYAVEIEKDPDKDFVVLNFADIQLSGENVFNENGVNTDAMLRKCIEEVQPDLITLTGDNSSSQVGYLRLAELLDSYDIPWAPVMGNHDGENGNKLFESWVAYTLADSENCLFKFGPTDMGYGNYIINITENGQIIHTLFMMDTHSYIGMEKAGEINRGESDDSYDHLWANQIEWYTWAVNGIKDIVGHTVESSVYMHIPVVEYRDARDLMCETAIMEDRSTEYVLKEEYARGNLGTLRENVCCPEGNNGFFNTCSELGSTKTMVVGHDHTNSLAVNYQGINLTYSLKSGYGSYWDADRIGGSLLTINADGNASFSHHFCN